MKGRENREAKVSAEVIKKTVALARLEFSPSELDHYVEKASRVLEYVATLGELATETLEPTSHALEIVNAFRSDEVRPTPQAKAILEMAPARDKDLFEVPRVIEET